MNKNPWVKIADTSPMHRVPLEWFHEYSENVFSGELFSYDGKYVRISMRHFYYEEALHEFSHWRLPSENPTEELKT